VVKNYRLSGKKLPLRKVGIELMAQGLSLNSKLFALIYIYIQRVVVFTISYPLVSGKKITA
jgi:hypothetical protein